MMEGTVVDVTLTCNTAQSADALTQMEVAVEQIAHKQQPALQIQQQVLQIRTARQQLEDATRDGLVIIFVMISITIWTAVMMAETVADAMLTQTGAQYVHALIQMEAGLEQLANLLQQQLLIQVIIRCGRVMADNIAYAKFRKNLLI